jgi:hypothetical protein
VTSPFWQIAIAVIGWSHALQPPTTVWLKSRVFRSSNSYETLAPLTRRVTEIMALTAVLLPTAIGIVIGNRPSETVSDSALRSIAFVLAGGLWTPRLIAQIFYVGPLFPRDARAWHWFLIFIFTLQGPVFLGILLSARAAGALR